MYEDWEDEPLYAANSNVPTDNVICLEYIITKQGDIKNVTDFVDTSFSGSPFTRIKLPKTLIKMEEGSFVDCFDLEEITIPSSVQIMEDNQFESELIVKVDSQAVVNKLYSSIHRDCQFSAIFIKEDFYDQTKPQIFVGYGSSTDDVFVYNYTQTRNGYAEYISYGYGTIDR